MNIQEFANMLNGREYGEEISNEEIKLARDLGFVVVMGASDDIVEFRGAIRDEVGCYDVKTIYFDKFGLIEACKDDCKFYQEAIEKAKNIKAIWNDRGEFCWTYETDIPHATFEIIEEGEKYCRGIVFEMKSLL